MHGFAALRLGDSTAKDAGRLTFNPLKHLDPFGSVLLPLTMVLLGSPFLFAWAKPVPYNPYNLKDKKYGEAKVAAAGPLANFAIAVALSLVIRLVPGIGGTFAILLTAVIYINLILMVFNLVPIPPLDGSKILATFLPERIKYRYLSLERFGLFFVFLFVFVFSDLIVMPVSFLSRILLGF